MKTMPFFRNATATLALALIDAGIAAAPQAMENDWEINNASVTVTPAISQLVAGHWVQLAPGKDRLLLEVRGTLKVQGDGSFGPVNLEDVKLLAAPDGAPTNAALVAIGVGPQGCRYVPAQVLAGNPTNIKLDAAREFGLERREDAGPVFFTARAPIMDICMAFEQQGTLPREMVWSFARRSIRLESGSLTPAPATGSPAGRATSPPPVAPPASPTLQEIWRKAISSPLVLGATALIVLALVGGLVLRRARRRRRMQDGVSSEPGSALDIPRVGPSHQPTTLTPVEPEAGPGRQHFQAALAALRLGEWPQANELFGKAIEAGLTPTYEAGAWSLRGDAMLNCDDLMGAVNCFLRSLRCPAVTTESVLLSAGHLAAIYRQLGFRQDAGKMDKLKLLASPFGSDLGAQRLELIARLASELKHKRRARMLARINPFA